jgi:hypothetical protein
VRLPLTGSGTLRVLESESVVRSVVVLGLTNAGMGKQGRAVGLEEGPASKTIPPSEATR